FLFSIRPKYVSGKRSPVLPGPTFSHGAPERPAARLQETPADEPNRGKSTFNYIGKLCPLQAKKFRKKIPADPAGNRVSYKSGVILDVLNQIADGLDLIRLLIGNLELE